MIKTLLTALVSLILLVSVPTAVAKTEADEGTKVDKAAKESSEDKGRAPTMSKKSTALALSAEAISELESKQRQLEEREKALDERSEAISVQERILQEKMRRIDKISKKMAERLDQFKARSQEKITKLVSVVEGMKPDAAAKFFESVDPNLAVEVLTRIDTKRASKILNKVDKDRSARLSELYTGYRSKLSDPTSNRQIASE